MINYDSSKDNLVPITKIADNLGLIVRKHNFSEEEYIPITMVPIKELYSDEEYQRLINRCMIEKAGKFDARLCRPIAIFQRPDGKKTIVDGQHSTTIGYLYTDQAGNLCVPCQMIVHSLDSTLDECVAIEAKYFEQLNKNRTNVGAIETLRSGIAYRNKDSLEAEQKLITMGVQIQKIGDSNGYEVSGLSRIIEAYSVGNNPKYAKKAINTYAKLIENLNSPNWSEVPMLGSLIAGLAKVWYLRDNLGKGDKGYVVEKYLSERLYKTTPKSLTEGTSGNSQSHLIAIRIITKINTLIEEDVLVKENGTSLKHRISEGELRESDINDPTKIK
jgi:hypothetical protein